MAQDTKKLFQITEAARACGISRSAPLLLPLCRSRRTVTIPSAQKTARKFRKEWAV